MLLFFDYIYNKFFVLFNLLFILGKYNLAIQATFRFHPGVLSDIILVRWLLLGMRTDLRV